MIDADKLNKCSYFTIIDLGMVCKIKYNDNGVLESITPYYSDNCNETTTTKIDELPTEVLTNISNANLIPLRLKTLKEPVEITGVFTYAGIKPNECGQYPYCVYADVIKEMTYNITNVVFRAVHYTSSRYCSIITQDTQLKMEGFDTIPTNAMSMTAKLPNIKAMFTRSPYPLISGLLMELRERNQELQIFDEYKYDIVGDIEIEVTNFGEVKAHIICTAGNIAVTVPYNTIVKFNIRIGTKILFKPERYNSILWSNDTKEAKRVSNQIECEFCGKLISVDPNATYTVCNDPHCPSVTYKDVMHMLVSLELPLITNKAYKALVKDGKYLCFSDILNVEPYVSRTIETDLGKLLDAIVPKELSRPQDLFSRFVAVAGSTEAVLYYLDNPEMIASDLGFKELYMKAIIEWMSDPYNNLMVKTILDSPNINIVKSTRSFEGVPLFREKKICLTGYFRNGDITDIIELLKAYSADVVVKFDPNCDCVLMGNNGNEDVNIINLALAHNKPIYQELDFFKSYGIDKDLAKAAAETVASESETPSLD